MNYERFFSEFGEDRWIAENLPLPATGYYVDVGCAHPTEGSNTAFLRARGWRGLAIDANPGYAPLWPADTFVQAFISAQPIVSFEFKAAHYESRVAPGHTRYAAPQLSDLWTAVGCPKLDLLTLDVEGHEYEALMSLISACGDLPPIIVSEYNTRDLGIDNRVRAALTSGFGYELVHTTPANHIFYCA